MGQGERTDSFARLPGTLKTRLLGASKRDSVARSKRGALFGGVALKGNR